MENVGIEMIQLVLGGIASRKGHEVGDLRCIHPVLLGAEPGLVQRGVGIRPDQRCVGVVREHDIHARRRQKLRLPALYPRAVVAIDRLIPEVLRPGRRRPAGIIEVIEVILQRDTRRRLLINELLHVEGRAQSGKGGVPYPVEQRKRPIRARVAHLSVGQRRAPQRIGEHPCVRHKLGR